MAKRLEYTEVVLNISLVLVAMTVGTVVLQKNRLFHLRPPITVGKPVRIEGVDPHAAAGTLLLFLRDGCSFCSESAPFYREVVRRAPVNNVRVVAVLQQPAEEGRAYLERLGLTIDAVYQAEPRELGVASAPTLLLLDHTGIAKRIVAGEAREDI